MGLTCSLHCSSFLGLPYRILFIYLVSPEKGTTMETIGSKDISSLTGVISNYKYSYITYNTSY